MNLRDDLHRVADAAPLEPIAMAGVRAKARSIRRRRAGAAAGGAALGVAAIAAAAVLLVPGSADRSTPLPSTQSPTPTATQSPSATQGTTAPTTPTTPSTSATVDRTVQLTLTNVPAQRTTGASLSVPNWMNGALTDAQGNAVQVSTPVYHAVHDQASGDWFGMTLAQGKWTWTQWSAQGTVVSTHPSPGNRVAVTDDGKTWAVMVGDARSTEIWVYRSGASAPTVAPVPLTHGAPMDGAGVDAILPNGDILFDVAPRDVRFGPPAGPFSQLSSRYVTGTGANPDGTMILTADTGGGQTCTEFVTETGRTTGTTCGGTNETYLPNADGSLVVRATYGAPNHTTSLTIGTNPAAGGPSHLTRYDPRGAVVDLADGAWIADTFVVPVWSNGTWQLVWLGTDGYLITRSLAQGGPSSTSPYLLGAGPLKATNP